MSLRIDDQAVRTDTGRQRSANEDSYFIRGPLFVVADGMGGAQAGEVASKAAAESFEAELPALPPEQALAQTIEAANRTIHELARKDPSLAGMGTTTTATPAQPAPVVQGVASPVPSPAPAQPAEPVAVPADATTQQPSVSG